MKKNKKKVKLITKQVQMKVRTGLKSGDAADDSYRSCQKWCVDQGYSDQVSWDCGCVP